MTATPTSVITDALSSFQDSILPIAAAGLAVGAVVLALKKGWGLAKKFVNG
jgi:hypothetical protein